MLTAIRPLPDDLKPQRHSSRVLYLFGGFWIFSALVHTGLLAATGFEWFSTGSPTALVSPEPSPGHSACRPRSRWASSLCGPGAALTWAIVLRPVDPLVSWAVIAGMVLVVAGLGIGQWLMELGNDFAATNGIVPETVTNGDAGTTKFAHRRVPGDPGFHHLRSGFAAVRHLRGWAKPSDEGPGGVILASWHWLRCSRY